MTQARVSARAFRTWPNTTCLPSRCDVGTVVMKNLLGATTCQPVCQPWLLSELSAHAFRGMCMSRGLRWAISGRSLCWTLSKQHMQLINTNSRRRISTAGAANGCHWCQARQRPCLASRSIKCVKLTKQTLFFCDRAWAPGARCLSLVLS